jgi:hypothetical protein
MHALVYLSLPVWIRAPSQPTALGRYDPGTLRTVLTQEGQPGPQCDGAHANAMPSLAHHVTQLDPARQECLPLPCSGSAHSCPVPPRPDQASPTPISLSPLRIVWVNQKLCSAGPPASMYESMYIAANRIYTIHPSLNGSQISCYWSESEIQHYPHLAHDSRNSIQSS